MKNGAKPINPILDWNELKADTSGLTKREYFAGLAMQGILSNTEYINQSRETLVDYSIKMADELLKQLEL